MIKYKKILIKLSGEALGKPGGGLDSKLLSFIAKEIADVANEGISIGLVIGAGNIFRGQEIIDNLGIERVVADQVGMLATMINALIFREVLEHNNVPTKILTALNVPQLAQISTPQKAWHYMKKGNCIIFAGGTGNPFFTTDTAAALRAAEIKAEVLIKATKVDGVYNKDPKEYTDAKLYDKLSYLDVLNKRLGVMDSTAISLCQENNIPVLVYNMYKKGNLLKAITTEVVGTLIK